MGLIYLLIFLPALLQAQENPVGEVFVYPEGPPVAVPRWDRTISATVLEGKEFAGRRKPLAEILEETSGTHIRRYGGLDDFATLSIRGSTSEQVTLFVDGILMNPAEGGSVNLATIPTEQIERIEIYRGSAPSRFPTSSLGGVISIETKRQKEAPTTEISTSYGSWNTLETSLFQGQTLKPLAYSVGYHFGHSDGDFTFRDSRGTPFNPSDDQDVVRRNNEWNRHRLLLRLGSPDGTVEIQGDLFREDRGIPGLGSLRSESADLSTTRSTTQFNWKHPHGTVAPFFQMAKQQFTDREGEIGLGSQDNDNDTLAYGVQSHSTFLLGRLQAITLAVGYRGETFLPEDFSSDTQGPTSQRHQGTLGIEDEILLMDERFLINPSLRSEHVANDLENEQSLLHPVSGKIGLRYSPHTTLHLTTNLARSYRLPNFSELFGDRGTLVGNPDLSPEKGWNWDLGTDYHQNGLRAGLTYFLNHTDDLIQILQTSQFTAQSQNLSQARIQGVETHAALPIGEFVTFSTNYTFQWAKDISGLPGLEGRFLPNRPRHEASAGLDLHQRLGRVFGELTYMDGNFLDSQNLLLVSNRTLVTAGLTLFPGRTVRLGVEGKNLLNDRVVDVVGFPLPGRSFYGKFEVSL